MSSKVQTKSKAVRKLPVKKTTAVGASKMKTKSKSDLKEELNSDLEGSSSDEKFMEEFESDGSDFNSSTDSDDISQEFSDEDKLMEYYEKKLREHAIVGNFNYNSDSGDSEPSQELKELVKETFTQKPKLQGENASLNTSAKKTVRIKSDLAAVAKSSGQLRATKSSTRPSNAPNVDMKAPVRKAKKGVNDANATATSKLPIARNTSARKGRQLSSPKPSRAYRTKSEAVRRPVAEAERPNVSGVGEDARRFGKVDYLARMKQVQNSISQINQKIRSDSNDAEILKSARAAILEQCHKKPYRGGRKRQNRIVSTSTSGSSTEYEDDARKQLKDEVVDRILNATLGVS